jgi:cytoskeletal protein RodZ
MNPDRRRARFSHVVAALAVVLVLGSGSAYAATQITGKNIKNNTVSSKDIKDASLTGADIADRSLSTSDVLDATLTGADIKDGSIGSADINDGGIGTADIADGAITTSDVAAKTLTAADLAANAVSALELQDNAVDTGAVVDFGLSNEDVGVLFAQVSSTGTVSNSSGGAVTASKIGGAGTGQYEVDFARNVSLCAFVATIGGATTGAALGEVNVSDRANNVEAVFVDTNESNGSAADKAFQLVVVC